jgi:hypothetical protein
VWLSEGELRFLSGDFAMSSFIRGCLVALVGIGLGFGESPDVKANELAVQGGSSTGGDAHCIVGAYGGLTRFSVTGAWNDRMRIFDCWGQVVVDCSIGELSTLPQSWLWPVQRLSSQKLSDGQTRVMLSMPCTPWSLDFGAVQLRRGSSQIDIDPIYLR